MGNDTLGHESGDQLTVVAQRIRRLRPRRRLCRPPGGDEFAILLDNLPSVSVARRRPEHRPHLSAAIDVAGQEIVATASIGISVYPDDGRDVGICCAMPTRPCTAPSRAVWDNAFYEAAMEVAVSDRLKPGECVAPGP